MPDSSSRGGCPVTGSVRAPILLMYKARGEPIDAIRTYCECLASSLREDHGRDARLLLTTSRPWRRGSISEAGSSGDVRRSLRELNASASVVLQYNPFSYCRWGLAPWLPAAFLRLRP